ncbi:MAG: hypothetical protein Q7V31_16025 [Parvibaculum sp.]|uniref:hypothetical protein n=1 Tax=Parvibaculum sp. TaxID=2024848 RepID=UPI002715BD28|nr:hypothetical protein [Parvibaculum sp.]MDO8840421.1 hypothetical protein [Parvibaculum sp.]
MCLSSSSKSSSKQETQTINRDERIAADGASTIYSLKDLASGKDSSVSIVLNDMSGDALSSALAFSGNALDGGFDLAQGISAGVLDFAKDVLGFAADNADRSVSFAAATQASYADAVRSEWTNDLTEVINNALNVVLIVGALYVAAQVLK